MRTQILDNSWRCQHSTRGRLQAARLIILLALALATKLGFAQTSLVGPYPIYKKIGRAQGLAYTTATAIGQDRAGNYWIGCPVGIQRFDLLANAKLYRFGDSLSAQVDRWPLHILSHGDSLLALSGSAGYYYSPSQDKWNKLPATSNSAYTKTWQREKTRLLNQKAIARLIGHLNIRVTALAQYDPHRVFVGSTAGLYELRQNQEGTWQNLSGNEPLAFANSVIEGLYLDSYGNLHIAEQINTVTVISHHTLEGNFLPIPASEAGGVWGMHALEDGRLFVTARSRLYESNWLTHKSLQAVPDFPVLVGRNLRDVHVQGEEIVVATNQGCLQRTQGRWTWMDFGSKALNQQAFFRCKPGPDPTSIDLLASGHHMRSGLESRWRVETNFGSGGAQIFDSHYDAAGTLWLATVRGLYSQKLGQKPQLVALGASDKSPIMRVIPVGPDTLYLVSLDIGLWRIIQGAAPQLVPGSPARALTAYVAEADRQGRIWMGSANGVDIYLPDSQSWHHIPQEAGWPMDDHDQTSSAALPDGRLAFGGRNGVFLFEPNKVLSPKPICPLQISQLSLDGKTPEQDWQANSPLLYKSSIRYLDIGLLQGGKLDTTGLVGEYRMLGYEDQWRPLTSKTVSYSNVDFGEFVFETRLRDRYTGQFSPSTTLGISRPAPWYTTLWGKFGVVALIFSIGGMVMAGIANNKLKRRLEKAEQENRINAERVRIARDLHDNVGSTLTYLSSSLGRLDDVHHDTELGHDLNALRELTRESLWQLRETIWAANHTEVTLGEFSARLADYLRRVVPSARPARLKAELPTEATRTLAPGLGLYLFRIVQETLNNAIKYSQATQIVVEMKQAAGSLQLIVRDDGVGFDESSLPYTSGISTIQARAREIGGHAQLRTSIGQGTRWTITVPDTKTTTRPKKHEA